VASARYLRWARPGALVQGGNAGAGGTGSRVGANGVAGAGIYGSRAGLSVITGGTIQGGLNVDGSRAAPITFTGGSNTLELQAGYNIIGNVIATLDPNNPNTFALGGDQNTSFDLSGLGGRYRGFSIFNKTGASAWTLSGTPTSYAGTTPATLLTNSNP
jgi:fibronectin-binding autotransporter adhesin